MGESQMSRSYVGRVGGLAVALGVGAALVTGQIGAGSAWADGTDGAGGEKSSVSDPANTPDTSDDVAASTTDAGTSQVADGTPVTHDDDDDVVVDDEPVDLVAPAKRTARDSSTAIDVGDAVMDAAPDVAPDTALDAAATIVDSETGGPEEFTETRDAQPQPIADPAAADSLRTTVLFADESRDSRPPAPESKPVAGTVGLLSSVLTAVLAPFVSGGPAAPAPPPVPLALMAMARRDFGGALLANSATVDSVSTPLAAEATFTGRPSLVTQVFVAGLRLIKPVLGLFGVELNGTSARIPFFTDGKPPFFLTFGLNVASSEYQGWKVWTLSPSTAPPEKVVVAVHGGSFIATASLFHWWTYADMVRDAGATVVVPLYPLANEEGTGGTAKTVVPTVADFIADHVAEYGAENVSVIGDSAGGSIALAATQLLVQRCNGEPECLAATLPGHMVLLSPALDAGVTNPNVALVNDPLLNPTISKRNGQWWAKGLETADDPDGTKNPLASPLFGSLEHLPPTAVYAGSLDSRTPDVLVLQEKANATPGADFTFELRKGQFHDWTIFAFLPDGYTERPKIYRDLGLLDDN
ncbi:alpha/beta hydrolase [Mycolicibacterium sp. XJ1819]